MEEAYYENKAHLGKSAPDSIRAALVAALAVSNDVPIDCG